MNPDDRALLGIMIRHALATFALEDIPDVTPTGPNPPRGKGKVMYRLPDPVVKRDYGAERAKARAKDLRVGNRRKLGGRA